MSDAPPRFPLPRIEAEPIPAPRLDETALVPLAPEPRLRPRLPLSLIGAGILVLGLPALWAANFIAAQFDRASGLGWLTLAVAIAGFGLIATAILRELRGIFALDTVDRLRAELASGDPSRIKAAAQRWLRTLPDGASLLPAIEAADTPETVLALLRAGPAAALRAGAETLGRNAALQSAAIIAATPSPALDAAALGWRGLRLVRQVAALHGMRPGLFGTLALLRRTALAAASVAVTEAAVNTAAHALLNHPLLTRLLGDVAGAGVAARRMIVLARAAETACSPLPPET
jgi:putative membrane protein